MHHEVWSTRRPTWAGADGHPGPPGEERLHQEGAQQEANADEEVKSVDEGSTLFRAKGEDEQDTVSGEEDAVAKELWMEGWLVGNRESDTCINLQTSRSGRDDMKGIRMVEMPVERSTDDMKPSFILLLVRCLVKMWLVRMLPIRKPEKPRVQTRLMVEVSVARL
jgi:hypothetical protein